MSGGDVSESILDAVQKFDQQVAASRRVAEQCPHFGERLRVDAAALGLRATFALGPTRICDGDNRSGRSRKSAH
jgi:hypothetical protein